MCGAATGNADGMGEMSARQVRLWGDPFRNSESSQALRRFLAAAGNRGLRCALCLTGAVGEDPGVGRALALNDGARDFEILTLLDDEKLAPIERAATECVSATAPLVVFGREDQVITAGLEFPEACLVWSGLGDTAEELLVRLDESLAAVASEDPQPSVSAEALAPFADLGPPDPNAPFLHVSYDVARDGTDVLIREYARELAGLAELTVLLPERNASLERDLALQARDSAVAGQPVEISFAKSPLTAELVAAFSAVIWPLRSLPDPGLLLRLMASGRPLVVSRNSHTASMLSAPGLCYPIGGVHLPSVGSSPEEGIDTRFEPDPRTLVHGARSVLGEWPKSLAMARRARSHVLTHCVAPRPRPPAFPERSSRPLVVLEAPLFEASSSATLTIETARALHRRDRVDLRLVPRLPFSGDVRQLRRSAPGLVPLLARRPGPADLWLSAGWPPRADRPKAHCFALRLDWEYGSLPAELSPLIPQEADLIVVHSSPVHRTVARSGRSSESIATIPHGVDGSVFHRDAEPCQEVIRFKCGRPAILFVGGLIWRKGIDLFLKALAEVQSIGEICGVIKPLGSGGSYHGQNMEDLVRRFATTRGAPELLILDGDMERDELAGLYRACDLLLHPYRGEGFGMPVLEAQACGLPVLVSSGGSTDDFCDTRAALRIPTESKFPQLPGVYQSRPHVLEPDGDALTALLKRALEQLPELREAGRCVAGEMRASHTWGRAAEALERIAYQIAAQRADKTTGSAEPVGPVVATP